MIPHLHSYFRAEKAESLLFLLVGIAAVLGALWAFGLAGKTHSSMFRGFAIPLALVGVIQVVVGGTVFFRTDKQLYQLKDRYAGHMMEFKAEELERMDTVMKNFQLYKWVEVAFVIAGLAMVVLLRQKSFWLGFGSGLLLQGALMLAADAFAEHRGERYVEHLQEVGS